MEREEHRERGQRAEGPRYRVQVVMSEGRQVIQHEQALYTEPGSVDVVCICVTGTVVSVSLGFLAKALASDVTGQGLEPISLY